MEKIVDRFLKYVSFETTSNEDSLSCPSSPKELELTKYLVEELKALGLSDAHMDEFGYCYAHLDATKGCENADKIGFLAHVDTSDAVTGLNVKPQIVKYEGQDIKLNDKVSIKHSDYPEMEMFLGDDLIVTDGTTLLGADDKAGIVEIVEAISYLIEHPEVKHGRISIAFTPDEEIGRGIDHFNLEDFDADYAYTIDGGLLGEIEYECFNAAQLKVKINGISIHPGSAKNKMKNACLVLNELISMLPEAETPSHTEKYEGFYHVCEIQGSEQEATMHLIIRDHNMEIFKKRKEFIVDLINYLNKKYGEGTIEYQLKDTYYNMREKIETRMEIVEKAEQAMRDLGITPIIQPIRGGTDGSGLTQKGLLCPNLSVAGGNFHGVLEYVSIQGMEKMRDVIVKISEIK